MQDKGDRYSDPHDDIGNNPHPVGPIAEIIALRLSRREALKGMLTSVAVMTVGSGLGDHLSPKTAVAASGPSTLTFEELAHGVGPDHQVAPG
jgi:hypothetical protein